MSGLQPLDQGVYPGVAGGDEVVSAAECCNIRCRMPASSDGDGAFICEHEHMATEAEFCLSCWVIRQYARWTWHCWRCYGEKPDGSHEDWGHLCPMTLVLPSARMST
jgi:hypothetical protein